MLRHMLALTVFAVAALLGIGCQQQSRSLQGTWTGTTADGATLQLTFGAQSALSGQIEAIQAKVLLGGTYVEDGDELTINATIKDVELPKSVPPQVKEPMMKALEGQMAGIQTGKITWLSDDKITINWAGQSITLERS